MPTVERARALGLTVVIDPPGLIRGPREVLALEPTRVLRQAAVIVVGSATRRSRVPIESVLLPSAAAALGRASEEPPIETPLGSGGLSLLVSVGEKMRCVNDSKNPGFEEHRACRGIGCPDCNDTGEIRCSKCRGEGGWVRVRSLYVTEERWAFHNVYSPGDLPLELDNRVQAMLGPPFVPPEETEWHGELATEAVGYRDAARDPRSVFGFSLAPAIDTALRFLDDTREGGDQCQSRVFGWPLLRLFYAGAGQAVIFPTPDGAVEALGCAARPGA